MAFSVEVTYRTKLGNLIARMMNGQTVATRAEAEELRDALKALPELTGAMIAIKNAKPLPTVDEAVESLRKGFAEYPPIVVEG